MAKPEILDVPPQEAIDAFRSKGFHVGFDWRDTDALAHVQSFTVAKAMKQDILRDIRTAVDASMADGKTFQQFRDRLEPLLRKKGWWGQQIMTDPLTGEERLVQLGSARRLRIIFDTNLHMSYAYGRWEHIERLKDRMPYLRYVAVQDSRTRLDHIRWHGAVLPVDHPFWKTHYPPNGWGCRCIVQQMDDDDLHRYGYKVSSEPPPGSRQTRLWKNKRTGQVQQVPVGIDPGFSHNVGLAGREGLVQQSIKKLETSAKAANLDIPNNDLDRLIARGRAERKDFVSRAGDPKDAGFADRLRDEIRKELRERRGAGTVKSDLVPALNSTNHRRAARLLQEDTAYLPASWVTRANSKGRTIIYGAANVNGVRGYHLYPDADGYQHKEGKSWFNVHAGDSFIKIGLNPEGHDQGTRVHEFMHRMQSAMPDLDKPFQRLHRRRTKGEKLAQLSHYPKGEMARKDQYLSHYQGREYSGLPHDSRALEVITMAHQYVWQRKTHTGLMKMVDDDPEMLDLVLGTLFHYDP